MSYISAWRKGNDVHVWERTPKGRITKTYAGIFEFFARDPRGKYTSIYNEPLSKFTFPNWWEFNEAKKPYASNAELLYESDIGPELKVLAEHYYQVDAPKLNLTLWDIEVDYDEKLGFSSIENPYAPINAVALFHQWKQESKVIAVPPKNWDKSNKLSKLAKETNTEIILVNNERELLLMLLDEFEDSDVISGWNSDWFDTPYFAKRLERVLGPAYFKRLSFRDADAPKYREVEVFGQPRTTIDLGGRISWDYLELFRKFEMSERPSYSLEAISNELLPDLPKLEYDGTLAQLYNKDFEHFVRYNIRDTEVLAGFERLLGYISLANVLYHSSCGQPNQIFGPNKLAALAIINHCHRNLNKRLPDWDMYKEDGRIAGAMVLTPKVGLHDNIGSIDITSLYPSAIRCVNISPETLVGQTIGVLESDDRAKHTAWEIIYNGDPERTVTVEYDRHMKGYEGEETHTGDEWREILFERKWAISGYGTFFRQDEQGIIPAVLTDWFAQRKHYKKLMGVAKDAAVSCTDKVKQRELEEQAAYYDRLQYVYKIKLNSLYGALTNYHFRLFDLRLGQSTTGSGRAILHHMCAQTALILDGEYNMFSDSIVYGDTDSVYFKTNAEVGTEGWDKERIYQRAIKIADRIGQLADESFDDFCKKAFCIQPEFQGIIKCDREVVAKRGIFVSKKRYVLKLIDLDGYRVNKLKAMGLEMKKTTTPKLIQKFLEDVVNMILDGEAEWPDIDDFIIEYRNNVRERFDPLMIGLPKGVKKVEYYTSIHDAGVTPTGEKPRLPGHVAASIHYNECLKKYNDNNNQPIITGNKIKVFYLTQKCGKFKSIAFPTDTTKLPSWFTDNYSIDRELHEEKLIDDNLAKIFTAIGRSVPTAQSKFNDSLMEW